MAKLFAGEYFWIYVTVAVFLGLIVFAPFFLFMCMAIGCSLYMFWAYLNYKANTR